MAQTTKCQNISRTDVGNGQQKQFTTPLPYIYQTAICVYLWKLNNTSGLYEWVKQVDPDNYTFVNEGTIEFVTAPPAPPSGVTANIKIVRLTDVNEQIAVFQPGSAIRARDLNDNFDQLIFAAQESACGLDQLEETVNDNNISITELQQNVATNTSNIASNTNAISALDERVTTNETDIAALQAGGGGGGDYTLPKASATVLGGIKVGGGLAINSDGVLAATGGGGGGGAVNSVNGQQGDVLLTASDVGALPDTTTAADIGALPDTTPLNFIPLNDWSSLPQVTA